MSLLIFTAIPVEMERKGAEEKFFTARRRTQACCRTARTTTQSVRNFYQRTPFYLNWNCCIDMRKNFFLYISDKIVYNYYMQVLKIQFS